MTDVDIPRDTGDFRLITRRVLDILVAMPERHRFIRGMVAWIGGRQVPLMYDRRERVAGESKYPLRKMIRFAFDAITAFSVVPLTAAMTIGWVMSAVGLALFVYAIFGWLAGAIVPGWTSLMAAVGLLGGMQFLMLGIVGTYLGRLYDQSKGRPLFIIGEVVGSSHRLESASS
jgi:dolichol-phosphate mannosyltransferase